MNYLSVIGFGKAEFIEDDQAKREALDIIMKQYSDKSWVYKEGTLKKITIMEVKIENITGKRSGN